MKDIIATIRELKKTYEELLILSKEKTDVIKEGSIEKMQDLLVRERKLARIVEKIETERMKLVNVWFEKHHPMSEEKTVTAMLEQLKENEERDALENITIELTHVLTDFKSQEKLNFELIRQSMQFIELSMDLISPSIKNMNYGNETSGNRAQERKSVFDSKA